MWVIGVNLENCLVIQQWIHEWTLFHNKDQRVICILFRIQQFDAQKTAHRSTPQGESLLFTCGHPIVDSI